MARWYEPRTWAALDYMRGVWLNRFFRDNPAYLKSRLEPIGIIDIYTRNTPPDANYKLCDGSPISRTTYATLFGIIGTAFGSGDGSTTFNLPNLSGRFPVGVSTTKALASTGGAATVNLITSNLPLHSHTASPHVHILTTENLNVDFDLGGLEIHSPGNIGSTAFSTTTSGPSGDPTGSTGSGDPVDIMNSYLAQQYVIKVL